MKKTDTIFPYFWHTDDSEIEITKLRIYALNKKNETVVLRVDDFTPYVYLELPTIVNEKPITWDAGKAQLLSDRINEQVGYFAPVRMRFLFKKKLYFCQVDFKNKKEKMFPYLLLAFASHEKRKKYGWKVSGKNFFIRGIGNVLCRIHEQDASPVLQLTCHRKIPTAGWVRFSGKQLGEDEKITLCDYEYQVKWKNLSCEGGDDIPRPLILSMDIEVNSTNPQKMPDSGNPGDKVFQISCVLRREGEKTSRNFLLTLGEPSPKYLKNVEILSFSTEADLLNGYAEFLQEYKPNIVTGYNILGFDIPYMIDRAKFNFVIDTFKRLGYPEFIPAQEREIKWSSAAYKVQNFKFLDAEGILHVDLFPLVKRDYKFNNYKLKTVSEFFIGQTKDPLTPQDIFKYYRIGMKGGEK